MRKPSAVSSTISKAQSAITGLLRSTALMLDTQAVTMSTSRSAIIGSDTAAAAKVSAANTEPTAEPISRNSTRSPRSPGCTGRKALTIMPARDHSSRITSCARANTPACPTTRRASAKEWPRLGVRPAPSSRLTQ